MTAIALQFDFRRKIMVMLAVALLAFALGTAVTAVIMHRPGVTLNPCRTCGQGCGCPRLSGSIRCNCPQ